ncbi:MAG TPA: VanZ family protein [Ignavibacteria bacterium]|nr:VanZ family protein [Ignavibacteria bacterium]
MKAGRFLKYHFPFLAWLLIIFIQSSFPAVELPKVEVFSADKIVHMGVYGLLAALCFISFIHIEKQNLFTGSAYLWSAIITILYGASDEIHQYFVPNRSSELQDWLADIAGIIIMLALIKLFLSKKMRLFKKEQTNG